MRSGTKHGSVPSENAPPAVEDSKSRFWRSRRVHIAVVAVLVTATAGIAIANNWPRESSGTPKLASSASTETAKVARQTLAEKVTVRGTLGYGPARDLASRAEGTVTALPPEGLTIAPGEVLYRINDHPVVLVPGLLPAWRTIEPGMGPGADVKQIETALAGWGYFSGTPDENFTAATGAAISGWRKDKGLSDARSLGFGDFVFAPGPIRAAANAVQVGSQVSAGTPVLKVTSPDRVVSVNFKPAEQALATVARAVHVNLPGKSSPGKITAVGAAKTTQENGKDVTTIPATIVLDATEDAGKLQEYPVSIDVSTDKRENVLTVPAAALIALRDGNLGVEVVHEGKPNDMVPVTTGLFAGGFVEVTGSGLEDGQDVVVPQS
ncbi:peptidoglycan-binding protein [Arthrobacter methylotrophus]|uniref:HlyD family efflux transporter periplasmic adaptor subunit n=1 Tax=Arthrobacter methylotrophus TaxID=121291 RepID=A0ABV5ULN6_9MICC